MAVPVVVHPSAAYATKVNIAYPGTQTQATAAESEATSRIDERFHSDITVTVGAGSIKVAA